MQEQTKQILEQALKLSPEEQHELAEHLLMNEYPVDPAIESAWVKEAESRLRAWQNGELQSVEGEEVFARIRAGFKS